MCFDFFSCFKDPYLAPIKKFEVNEQDKKSKRKFKCTITLDDNTTKKVSMFAHAINTLIESLRPEVKESVSLPADYWMFKISRSKEIPEEIFLKIILGRYNQIEQKKFFDW